MSTDLNSELRIPDNIPFEIQVEIIKHLPIKSLIQCTLLSKQFNAIIKSPLFITKHSARYNQHHHLFAWYKITNGGYKHNFVSINDNNDDNLPQNKVPISVPETVHLNVEDLRVLSYSRGLLCLFDNMDRKCYIWNPLIQRCIVIPILNTLHSYWVVGFGVCPDSCDPRLVKISMNWDIEVYTVSSRVWRTIPCNKPRKSITLTDDQVVINGIIYFLAILDFNRTKNETNMIITFDLISEQIGEVYLPDNLAHSYTLFLRNRMESLALLDIQQEGNRHVHDVWIMKHGVPNTFEKLFSFKEPVCVLDFRKTGEPILLRFAASKGERFVVYRPNSKRFTDLEFFKNGMRVVTAKYLTETLLLIDQPNTIFINFDDDNDNDDDDDDGDDDDVYDKDEDEDDDDDDDDCDDDDDEDDDENDDTGDEDVDDAALPLIDMLRVN